MTRPGPKRDKLEREKHYRAIAELRLKGYPADYIAQYLELSVSQVYRDIQKIEKLWREQTIIDTSAHKQRELDHLLVLQRELWQSWEESKRGREVTVSQIVAGAGAIDRDSDRTLNPGGSIKQSIRSEKSPGDVRYLAELLKVVTLRAKLLRIGADDPSQNEKGDRVTIPGDEDIQKLSDTELNSLIQAVLTS